MLFGVDCLARESILTQTATFTTQVVCIPGFKDQSGNVAGNSSHLERNHLHGMMFRYRQRMAERQRSKTTAILKWLITVLPVEG